MEAILKADEFANMPCAQLANKSQRNPWKYVLSIVIMRSYGLNRTDFFESKSIDPDQALDPP